MAVQTDITRAKGRATLRPIKRHMIIAPAATGIPYNMDTGGIENDVFGERD